eukprot:4433532-Pyramimonas_sp.AAC.1
MVCAMEHPLQHQDYSDANQLWTEYPTRIIAACPLAVDRSLGLDMDLCRPGRIGGRIESSRE